jgi:hypothetical protein
MRGDRVVLTRPQRRDIRPSPLDDCDQQKKTRFARLQSAVSEPYPQKMEIKRARRYHNLLLVGHRFLTS